MRRVCEMVYPERWPGGRTTLALPGCTVQGPPLSLLMLGLCPCARRTASCCRIFIRQLSGMRSLFPAGAAYLILS